MKLSEAIRLGAMMGPQIFGEFFGGPIFGEGTCALGGAIRAVGADKNPDWDDTAIWPWLLNSISCPVCGMVDAAGAVISGLNDDHRWTRERIADWVATIEPQEVRTSETNGKCSLGKGDYKRIRPTAVSQD